MDLDTDPFGTLPPTKRQKLTQQSYRGTPQPLPSHDDEAISSDTEGSAPSSPPAGAGYMQDEDNPRQVTVCIWRGCNAGDLGNMDALVDHIHEEHVGTRRKNYICEWLDCLRLDSTHASAYALRAHMRSHTGQKPFHCPVPGLPFPFASFATYLADS